MSGGIYGYANARRKQRQEALTPQQKAAERAAAKLKLLQPVRCAPVLGDPHAIDWENHDCGYVPLHKNGRPVPKTQEPAWQWTEEQGRGRQPCMRKEVNRLALEVYRTGHKHNKIALHDEGGFPDDQYWGRFGPKLLIRELKAMKPDWKRGQKQHLLSLAEAGLDVGVWYPCCILSGRVDEELAALVDRKPCGPYWQAWNSPRNGRNYTWQDVADGALNAIL